MWVTSATLAQPDLLPAWISAIATVLAAGAAVWAILATGAQVRRASAQEAANSDAQTRPYVGVDIVPSIAGSGAMDIVFENHGRAVARGIRVGLVSDQFRAQSDADEIGPALGRLFATPFDLAPGARRRVFWRMPADSQANPPGDIGTPIAGEVAISYAWEPRDGRSAQGYSDSIKYDLTEYPKLTPLPASGSEAKPGDAEAIQKNTVHALRAIARSIGELNR
ncbi:hypothetical protein ABE10_12615 [Bacillus toyonensis]|nr:hypothetical protein [Bacillus toyonensis]